MTTAILNPASNIPIVLTARCAKSGAYLATLAGSARELAGKVEATEARFAALGKLIRWTST